MAGLTFTLHQQQAIEASGGSLLVSAAAGSGKTAVLTERVIRLLTGENPIPADRLIVVTFTVAAADEMRGRIAGRLAELLEENPADEWLQTQQLLLSGAKICTIHSLCSGLIRDNLQKLGLSGELRIADETDLAVLQKQALDEVLEEHYSVRETSFLELVEFTCLKNDKPLVELIQTIYSFIRSFPFPLDYLEHTLGLYRDASDIDHNIWSDSIKGHIAAALSTCEAILKAGIAEMSGDPAVRDKYLDAFRSDLTQITRVKEQVLLGHLGEAAAEAGRFQKQSLAAVRKYPDPAFLEHLKGRRKKAADIFGNITKRYLCCSDSDFKEDISTLLPRITTLFSLVREVYIRIEEKKREEGVLDYADLEHYALRLLVEKGENGIRKTQTAVELSEQYDEVMIDECQDINEIQNLIFTLLSKEETNLFQVGDVKQSIYRFRKAEPGIFIEKQKTYSAFDPEAHHLHSKETIRLETNFRSRKEVCSIVNFVFSRLMTEEMGEMAYGEEEYLVPGSQYPPLEAAAPELHIIDYDRDEDDEKIVVEARYLADRIRRMVDEGYPVTENGKLRPCRYRDFAVLLRSCKDKALIYVEEMKKRGIPSFSESTEGYFDSYEIVVMRNLLRIIDNPLLDVPLLSVLLSPMFAFSADQIAQLRLIKKNVPLYRNVLSAAQNGDVFCSNFLSVLGDLRKKASALRVDRLIREIYECTDFLALAGVMEDGKRKDANLRLLLTYAEKYETNGSGGLSGFLRYLDRVVESGKDLAAANTAAAHADCVRILSIHKSKGLEFPICIVADCSKKFNKTDLNSRCQLNSKLGFSMKISDPDTFRRYNNLPFEAIRLQSEKESISEEMRVLYVAMTRAREKLILLMTLPQAQNKLSSCAESLSGDKGPTPYEVFQASGYDGWLLPALFRHPGFSALRHRIGAGEVSSVDADFPLHCFWEKAPLLEEEPERGSTFEAHPLTEILEQLDRRFSYQYPRKELTALPAKLTPTAIAKQSQGQKVHLNMRPAFLQKEGLTPAQRGTILHCFMQFADFSAAESDLEKEIARLIQKGFLTQAEGDALNRTKIEAFLSSSLYGRMKCAQKLLREYKFLYFMRADEVNPDISNSFADTEILIQGIADCLLFEDDGITIIDYKTDVTNHPEELAERYRDQLNVYREAISRAFSQPVQQCLLYSLHMEREIEIK